MWDAVSPVSSGYDPVVAESPEPVRATVMNAGPAVIRVRAWDERQPSSDAVPATAMDLHPGATTVVYGRLIRLQFAKQQPAQATFAGVAWRVGDFCCP
jgi:hypothetical protein